jgi:N6-L-threonylcarbamoyladenine synthase
MTRILAIETSCDETAAAVVEDGRRILSNVVATQIELHKRFGGVFPEVASRQHVLSIQPVITQALEEAGLPHVTDADAIAVTYGPGLAGSLLVGVNVAKGMSLASEVPLLAINHLEGHIYSNWLVTEGSGAAAIAKPLDDDAFPAIVLIVSGGHTELVLMTGHGLYQRLGGTLDDAAGEAFDKVARLLNLGFPGGPAIQWAATNGNAASFDLPRALLHDEDRRFDFSFSGLKTAVVNLVRDLETSGKDLGDISLVADVAASFQEAVVDVLVTKALAATQAYGSRQVCICGGVSANARLRALAQERCAEAGYRLYIPPLFLCTDNAAMIGSAAYYHLMNQQDYAAPLDLDVYANLPLPMTA